MIPIYPERDFIYVPNTPNKSYGEACAIIESSPSASAIVSRRCLEQLLQTLGHNDRSLSKQIISAKEGPDFTGVGLFSLFADTIRRIGNLAAHPSDLESADHPFELEYEDAQWCLQILETLFDFFYEIPLDFEMRAAEFEGRVKEYKIRISSS
jgi:hypothetical protein